MHFYYFQKGLINMSNKKELNLDELDAVSGGVEIGSSKTAGMDEFFPANDPQAFNDFCFENGVTDANKEELKKSFTKNGLSMHFDGATNKWVASN